MSIRRGRGGTPTFARIVPGMPLFLIGPKVVHPARCRPAMTRTGPSDRPRIAAMYPQGQCSVKSPDRERASPYPMAFILSVRPAIPACPQGASRTGFAVWIIDTFFVWTTYDSALKYPVQA